MVIRGNQEDFQNIFDTIEDFLFILDPSGHILQVNSAVLKRLGYAADEISRMDIRDLLPLEQQEEFLQTVQDMLAGRCSTCQFPVLTKDGDMIPVESKANHGTWSHQEALLILSRDISERLQLEAEQWKAAEEVQDLYSNAPCGYHSIDQNGLFVRINDTELSWLGYSREEILGRKRFVDVLTGESAEVFQRIFHVFKERGWMRDMECEMVRKDGTILPVLLSATAVYDSLGEFSVSHHTIFNIAERKLAQAALYESEGRWKFALEGTDDGIWDWSVPTNQIYFSPRWKQMLGYTDSEIPNELDSWESRIHPDDFSQTKKELDGHLNGELPVFHNEHRLRCKNGKYKWVLTRGKIMSRDKGGQPIRFIGTLSDITERKRAEGELQRLYRQTQQDAQTKADLLAEINHRVKNNLITILGLLLTEQHYAPTEGRGFVDTAMERLSQRIKGLLKVHQMLSDTQWEPMDLKEVAARIIHFVVHATAPDCRIDVQVHPSVPAVSPRQANTLALVFNELATNTIKYALEARPDAGISVRAWTENNMICIRFQDDGPGYPPEVLQLKQQHSGLRLIRQMVKESLRGKLSLSNENGAVATILIKPEEERRT